MGAGYHGAFGATKGSIKYHYGDHYAVQSISLSREQLLAFLDGKTLQSSEIADKIRMGLIRLSVLGDDFFERVFGVSSAVVGLAIENKIYVRGKSGTIYSDIVHEGTHAMDFLKGLSYEDISSWDGEIRAYTYEHYFQKASGLPVQFANEDDIKVHVWKYYRKKGGR